jgi:hypothetical protein
MDPLLFTNHIFSPPLSNLCSKRTLFTSISLVSPFVNLSIRRSVVLPRSSRPTGRVRHVAALQDGAATAAVAAGAYLLVYTFDKLTERQFIEQVICISLSDIKY